MDSLPGWPYAMLLRWEFKCQRLRWVRRRWQHMRPRLRLSSPASVGARQRLRGRTGRRTLRVVRVSLGHAYMAQASMKILPLARRLRGDINLRAQGSQCAKGGVEKFEDATVMAASVLVRNGDPTLPNATPRGLPSVRAVSLRPARWIGAPLYRDPYASGDHGVGASEVL